MLADPQLLALLRGGSDAGGDRARILRLYMSYQPCHHSGGRLPEAKTPEDARKQLELAARRKDQGHPTSCSERLRAFYEAEMREHAISLELVVADLYKAMWTEDLMIERAPDDCVRSSTYCADAASARQGILLLVANAPGVTMRATDENDWAYLATLCDPAVAEAYATRGQLNHLHDHMHACAHHGALSPQVRDAWPAGLGLLACARGAPGQARRRAVHLPALAPGEPAAMIGAFRSTNSVVRRAHVVVVVVVVPGGFWGFGQSRNACAITMIHAPTLVSSSHESRSNRWSTYADEYALQRFNQGKICG